MYYALLNLYPLGRAVVRGVLQVVHGMQVDGLDHVPKEGPVILAANHISYLDPPALGAVMPRPVHFMAKAELFKIPLLGWFITRTNAFPVHRGASDRKAIRHAWDVLERGEVFALFPEGTRSRTGELLPPQRGISLIALRTEAPVIPVGITGTSSVDRKLHPVRRPRVGLSFGPSVPLDDLRTNRATKDALTEASERVMAAISRQIEISRRGRIMNNRIE